ncbi:MAG: U32 family peptidase [Tenericutes bacterium]|nr:U32 family peptidase [Mycoplasmatota bacterium]
MRFVARLKTTEEAKKLNQLGIDVFCLDTEFSAKKISLFNLEEIKELTKTYPNQISLNINKIIHETDLVRLKEFLYNLKTLNISGIVIADLTVFVLAKELDLEHLIIYQPGTMNTDTFSETYFFQRKIKGITLSREITLDEIKKFGNTKLELSLIGHGYLDMFYSKRKLITNYLKHKELSGLDLQNNYDLTLREEIRENDNYPIFEDCFGTHIFRSKKIISYEELKDLDLLIKDFFIERIFLTDEEFYQTIQLYKNQISLEDFLKKYKDFDSGFYYKRTEKVKGDLDES